MIFGIEIRIIGNIYAYIGLCLITLLGMLLLGLVLNRTIKRQIGKDKG